MSRPPKPAATAKKVAPPAVPHEFRHSGSSFGSAGYASSEDTAFIAASEPPGMPRGWCSFYFGVFSIIYVALVFVRGSLELVPYRKIKSGTTFWTGKI